MKLDISNTEFRAYPKRDKSISLNLRTKLVIQTDLTFNLSAYLRKMNGWITIPGRKRVEISHMSVSVKCYSSEEIMIHDLYVQFRVSHQKLTTSMAKLRLLFDISFTNHPYEKSKYYLNKKAVIIPIFSENWLIFCS